MMGIQLQVAYLGSSNLFGRVVTTFLKQFPSIKRLNIYGCTDTAGISEEFEESCKVHQYSGKEQLSAALENVDIVVIGDETDSVEPSRECILNISSKVFDYAFVTASVAPKATVVVSAKPLNLMVPLLGHVLQELGCFDGRKLLGVTSEETLRSNPLFAELIGLEEAVLPVVGGASPQTRVPLFSQAKPSVELKEEDKHKLINDIKSFDLIFPKEEIAAERAYATIKLLRSLIRGFEKEVVTEMALTKTSLVADTSYFSLPVELGQGRVERAFGLPDLHGLEEELLDYAIVNLNHDLTRAYDIYRGLRPGLEESPRHQDHGEETLLDVSKTEIKADQAQANRKQKTMNPFPGEQDKSEGLSTLDRGCIEEVGKTRHSTVSTSGELGINLESIPNNHTNTKNREHSDSYKSGVPISDDSKLLENMSEKNRQKIVNHSCCPLDDMKYTFSSEPAKKVLEGYSSMESEDDMLAKLNSKNRKQSTILESNELSHVEELLGEEDLNILSVNEKTDKANMLKIYDKKKEITKNLMVHGPISCVDDSKVLTTKKETGDLIQDFTKIEEVIHPSKNSLVSSKQLASSNSASECNLQQSNYIQHIDKSREITIQKKKQDTTKDSHTNNEIEVSDKEQFENKYDVAITSKTELAASCSTDHQVKWENKADNHLTFTKYSIFSDQEFTSRVLRRNSGLNSPRKQHKVENIIHNKQNNKNNVNVGYDKKTERDYKMENHEDVKEVPKENNENHTKESISKILRNKSPRKKHIASKQANKLYQSPTDELYRGNNKKKKEQNQPQSKAVKKKLSTPIKKALHYKLRKSPKSKSLKRNKMPEKEVRMPTEKNKNVNIFPGHYHFKNINKVSKDSAKSVTKAKKTKKAEHISHDDQYVKTITKPQTAIIKYENNKTNKVSIDHNKNEIMKTTQNENKLIKTTAISYVNNNVTESLITKNQKCSAHRHNETKLENITVKPVQNFKVSTDKCTENINNVIKERMDENVERTGKYKVSCPFQLNNRNISKNLEEVPNANNILSKNKKEKSNHVVSIQNKSDDLVEKYEEQKLKNQSSTDKNANNLREQDKTDQISIIKKQSKTKVQDMKGHTSMFKSTGKNIIIDPTLTKCFPNTNPVISPTNKVNNEAIKNPHKPTSNKAEDNIKYIKLNIKHDHTCNGGSILGKELALNLGIKKSFMENKELKKGNIFNKKKNGNSNIVQNIALNKGIKEKSTPKEETNIGEYRKADLNALPSPISNNKISKNKAQVKIKHGIISSIQLKKVSPKNNLDNITRERNLSNENPKQEFKIINTNQLKVEDKSNHWSNLNKTSNYRIEEVKGISRVSQNKFPLGQIITSNSNKIQSVNQNTSKSPIITIEPIKANGLQSSPKKEVMEKVNLKEIYDENKKFITVSSNNKENSSKKNMPITNTSSESQTFELTKSKSPKLLKTYTMLKKSEITPVVKEDVNVEECKAKIYEQSLKMKANNESSIVRYEQQSKEKGDPFHVGSSDPMIQKTKNAFQLERSGSVMAFDRNLKKSGVQKTEKILPSRSAHNLSLKSFDSNNTKENQINQTDESKLTENNKQIKNKFNIYKMKQHKNPFEPRQNSQQLKEASATLNKKHECDINDTSKSEANNHGLQSMDEIPSNTGFPLKDSTSVVKEKHMASIYNCENHDKLRNVSMPLRSFISQTNPNSDIIIRKTPKKETHPNFISRPIESPRKTKSNMICKIESNGSEKEKTLNINNYKTEKKQENLKVTEKNKIINKKQIILKIEENACLKNKSEFTKEKKILIPLSLPTTNINILFNKFLNKSLKKKSNHSFLALNPWSNVKNHIIQKNDISQAILQQNKPKTNYLRWSTKALKASQGINTPNLKKNMENNKANNAYVAPIKNPFSVGQIKITSGLFKEYMSKNRSFNLDFTNSSQKRNFIPPGLIEESSKNETKNQNIPKQGKNFSLENKNRKRSPIKEINPTIPSLEESKSRNAKLYVSNIKQLNKIRPLRERNNEVKSKFISVSKNESKTVNSKIEGKMKKEVHKSSPEISYNSFKSTSVDKTMKPIYTPSARNFLDLTPTKMFTPYAQKERTMKKIHFLKAYNSEDKNKKSQKEKDNPKLKNVPCIKTEIENYNNISHRQKNYEPKLHSLGQTPQSPDREMPMFQPSQAVRKLKEENSIISKTEPLGHFRTHLQRLFNMFQSVISNETK